MGKIIITFINRVKILLYNDRIEFSLNYYNVYFENLKLYKIKPIATLTIWYIKKTI